MRLEVQTLDGAVKMRIPEGTQSGRIFRLRNKGIQSLRGGGRGDSVGRSQSSYAPETDQTTEGPVA